MKTKKQILFLLLNLFTLLILLFCFSCSKDGIRWKIIKKIKVKHETAVAMFFNDKNGVIGQNGSDEYTENGGDIWNKSSGPRRCPAWGIDFVDDKVGFTFGCNNSNQMTLDGGKSWLPITHENVGDSNGNISFISKTTGWVGNSFKVISTSDGGKSWAEINLPERHRAIIAVCLILENTGYIFDVNFDLFKTKDACKTWQKLPLNLNTDNYLQDTWFHRNTMRFYNEKRGDIVVWKIKPYKHWINFHTEDGGVTWTQALVPGNEGTVFLSPDGKYITILEFTNNMLVIKKN